MRYKKQRYISPVTGVLYIFEITDDSETANEGWLFATLVHGNPTNSPVSTLSSELDSLVNEAIPALVTTLENPEA